MLLMPEDISHHAADTVSDYLGAHAVAGSKANLNRNVGAYVASWDHPVANLHYTDMYKPNIALISIEKRPDEPTALKAAGARKLVSGHSSTEWRLKLPAAYLPDLESLMVSSIRPLARRRARTLRPFLEAIRERKPCLLARLRRLG